MKNFTSKLLFSVFWKNKILIEYNIKDKLNFILLFIATLTIYSCSGKKFIEYENKLSQDSLVVITGKIQNSEQESYLVLYQLTDKSEIVDTIKFLKNGEFNYSLIITTPSLYYLNILTEPQIYEPHLVTPLALFKEDVKIFYDFKDPNSLKIEGSNDSQNLLKMETYLKEHDREVSLLEKGFDESFGVDRDENIPLSEEEVILNDKMQQEFDDFFIQHNNNIKRIIDEMDDSFASLWYIKMLNSKTEVSFISGVLRRLISKYPNSPTIEKYYRELVPEENCRGIVVDYLNSLGVKILFLNDEGYRGGVCQGGPGQYCGRVEKFYNGKYWAYDIVVFTEKDKLGNCSVKGSNDNFN
jgi:hypothetical protein